MMYEKVMSQYSDELRDVVDYMDMAKNAENDAQRRIFKDIASEEYEHATMLKHILEKHGKYAMSEDLQRQETEAHEALRPI